MHYIKLTESNKKVANQMYQYFIERGFSVSTTIINGKYEMTIVDNLSNILEGEFTEFTDPSEENDSEEDSAD